MHVEDYIQSLKNFITTPTHKYQIEHVYSESKQKNMKPQETGRPDLPKVPRPFITKLLDLLYNKTPHHRRIFRASMTEGSHVHARASAIAIP